ncbi:TIR domain-containing protein [Paenibacillus sp. LS1]|uniref:TIR domain-containing protein n=1 Tax=Paenibacillus sp. LS1 TaxID=2992120 RepID=UPI00222EFC89|nr:TIR domain-containing protein [Paenibacillus sp. LS1]MCW3791479.1 TIR domain-containing protein [Paenibacillus sp. LS1]
MLTNRQHYNIFISHSWTYGDAYTRLITMLDRSGLPYKDYSVPKDDPIHNALNDQQLYAAIKNQVKYCNVVLMMCGVYATYSKWMNHEIIICKKDFNKPLIAIEPWGSERTSLEVKKNADKVVGWNSLSIANAIRELG